MSSKNVRAMEDRSSVHNFPTDDSQYRVGCQFHSIQEKDLKVGDHIYAYTYCLASIYQHHGIYVGTTAGTPIVIHFTGQKEQKTKFTAKITRSSLDQFLDGASLRLVVYRVSDGQAQAGTSTHTSYSLPAHQVVATAKHYAEHPEEWDECNL